MFDKDLINRASSLEVKLFESTGAYNALMEQKSQYIFEIQEAHQYIGKKDRILSLLMEIKERLYAKDISFIEELLTSLINDVIPRNDDKVIIQSKAENNRLSLDVYVQDGDKLRNVFADKGGSIQNIISIGLRLITLSRSQNRRFVIFDEADQGIKATYIPRLAEILYDLSVSLGIQILYISHHDPICFEGNSKNIKLRIDSKGLIVSDSESVDAEPSSEKEFFTKIRIKNFRRHQDTTLQLSPYLNIITGDNDIGKSTIVEAITSLTENAFIPSSVRDDCEYQSIEAIDSLGTVYTWQKNTKDKKGTKVSISTTSGELIQEANVARNLPSWWHDFLLMNSYFGVNIHISKQFNSHFIIGSETSGQKRAELLSFGSDMRKIALMVNGHTQKVKASQGILRSRKKDIDTVSQKIVVLLPIINLSDQIQSILSELNLCKVKSREINDLENNLSKIKSNNFNNEIAINSISDLQNIMQKNSFSEDVSDIYALNEALSTILSIESEQSEISIPTSLENTDLSLDTAVFESLRTLLDNNGAVQNMHSDALELSNACNGMVGLNDILQLIDLEKEVQSIDQDISKKAQDISALTTALEINTNELSSFILNEMPSCPSCGRSNQCTH
jgi:AAA15 family ATPase/GTPase